MKKMSAKNYKYYGFLGFLGFLGFGYFTSREIGQLFYFSFFSFFSYFFIGKLMAEKPDERYAENNEKARAKALAIPLLCLFLIGWGANWSFGTKEFFVIVSALGWAATFIAYALLFYWYEKH